MTHRDLSPLGARALALVVAALVLSAPVARADDALFEYRGRTYAGEDLAVTLQRLIHGVEAERYAALASLLDEAVYELYLDAQAAETGTSRAEVAARALAAEEPTAAEVERFYAENAARIGAPLESVRERIVRHLRARRLESAKAALVDSLKLEGGFRLLLASPPPPPVALDLSGQPVRGRRDAPITIVEFGDYQCPLCRRAAGVLRRLLERYPEDVRLVYLDFPVNRSGVSRRVAEGAVCAARQERFWEYHDLAFERQERLDDESPARLAEALALDGDAFARCMDEASPGERVREGERQARRLGLTATPAVFVDGRPLETSHLERALVEHIERRRERFAR